MDLSWLNFFAPGIGSVINGAVNGSFSNGSTGDNLKSAGTDFLNGFFNPFGSGSSDGSLNPIGSFVDNSLSSAGESIGNGLYGFVDKLINNLLGPIFQEANGDPDFTMAQAIGDLFTGGAVSANKETAKNNAWNRQFSEENRDYDRAFAEDERDYQRNVIDPFNMDIQQSNLDLQNQSLAHQISMDEFNKDLALHGTSYAAQDAASVGINPLAMSGQVSPFSSSVGSSGSSSGVSSNSASHSSPSNPSLGQFATFAPIQQALSSFLAISQQGERLDLESRVADENIRNQRGFLANETYDKQTSRLKALIDAKKVGFKVDDDLFRRLSEDGSNSFHELLRADIGNVHESTRASKERSYLDYMNYDVNKDYYDVLKDLLREETKSSEHDRGMKVWHNTNESVGKLFDLVGDIMNGMRRRTGSGRW